MIPNFLLYHFFLGYKFHLPDYVACVPCEIAENWCIQSNRLPAHTFSDVVIRFAGLT